MILTALVIVLLITFVVLFGIGIHWYLKNTKEDAKKAVRMVVEEVNKVNYYTYNYEKEQGQNVKNIDTNVQRLASSVESLRDDVLALQRAKTPVYVAENLEKPNGIDIGNVKLVANPDTSELVIEANGDDSSQLVTDNLRVTNALEVHNNMTVHKGISANDLLNGPMFEVRDKMTNARYGIGQFSGGTTRVYSPTSIALATVNNSGIYQDALSASANRVNVAKPLCFNDSACIVGNGGRLMVCPASNPDPTNTECKYLT